MKVLAKNRKLRTETGVALLISIFVLLLISVVAIALIVSSGTESALAGNYRTATGVYYAALAGLEEGRGRLLGKNSGSFKNTAAAGFIPSPMPMGQPVYIVNPVGSESITPWDPTSTYPDTEFNLEFTSSTGYSLPNPSSSTTSLSTVAGIQGPRYKWVRINAISEKSLNLDVDSDGTKDNNVLYYNNALSKLTTSSSGTQQVFEVTSFAVLPNGSQKMLQYLVALVPANLPSFPSGLNFPAALTIAEGSTNGVAFSAPTSSSYYVSGVDLTSVPFCTAGPPVDAIGVFESSDITNVVSGGNGGTGIPSSARPNYNGIVNPGPDAADVSSLFPSSLQTPSKLDNLAQAIIFNADAIVPSGGGNATGTDLTPLLLSGSNPNGMSPSNPMTVVVNGDLDLTGWHNTGYGLLLVTGNLNYDPDASWQGMVLVIGKGTVTGSRSGSGEFDGAFFVGKTRDSSGVLLPDPNLGKASVIFAPSMGSVGIRYSSCWVKASQPTGSFKVLSFHEIAQ
jgi:Tfp pilus assembly protein PilX